MIKKVFYLVLFISAFALDQFQEDVTYAAKYSNGNLFLYNNPRDSEPLVMFQMQEPINPMDPRRLECSCSLEPTKPVSSSTGKSTDELVKEFKERYLKQHPNSLIK